tara:strand:+ start:1614 stop:1745 length:132 start_codon:yes stop_codon:yes gene_type:complete
MDTTEKNCNRIEQVCLQENEEIFVIKKGEKSEFSEKPIRHFKY